MTDLIKIRDISFKPSNSKERMSGLYGWISCTLNGRFCLDGLTLRKTQNGYYSISFPFRIDGKGNRHFYYQPLDDTTRRNIEHQIFQALGIKEKQA